MYKKTGCNLVYIQEIKNENDVEIIKENVKIDIGEIYSTKYYAALNRDIELSKNIRLREHHKYDYQGGQLRYVIINDVKYIIDRINDMEGNFINIDLVEYK